MFIAQETVKLILILLRTYGTVKLILILSRTYGTYGIVYLLDEIFVLPRI